MQKKKKKERKGRFRIKSNKKDLPKIASFSVDHRSLEPGLYLSRQDWGINTYDLRFKRPNGGDYLSPGASHALEHLAASALRRGPWGEKIVYFGPMGCRTGFYLLAHESLDEENLKELLLETFAFIRDFEGEIPGATLEECGNYAEMDLPAAQAEAAAYAEVLQANRRRNLAY